MNWDPPCPTCDTGFVDAAGQCAPCIAKERDDLRAQLAEVQGQAAKMREALEHCRHRPHEHNPPPEFTVTRCEVIDRALAPDAGRALLDWVRLAVEALQAAEWGASHPTTEQQQCPACAGGPDVHEPDCLMRRALASKPLG